MICQYHCEGGRPRSLCSRTAPALFSGRDLTLPKDGMHCEGPEVRSATPHRSRGPAVFAPERRRSLLLNAVVFACAACGSPDVGVSVAARDSAGVVIVTNTASAAAPLHSIMIAPEPSTTIETNEELGLVPFFRVGGP